MSTQNKLRVAVVGAGIGAEHIQAYCELKDCFAVDAVCDLDTQRASKAAEMAGGARCVENFDDLCKDDSIDLIDICLPPQLHFRIAESALLAGKSVVCEKPLTLSLAQAKLLQELSADPAHGRLFPVFQYRCSPGFRALRLLLQESLTGAPLCASLETHWRREEGYFAEAPWRGMRTKAGGGALLSHAIHIHDMLCVAFGDPIAVCAHAHSARAGIDVEDNAVVAFRFAGDAVASSSVSLAAASEVSRMRLIFERMTVTSASGSTMNDAPWRFEAHDPAEQAQVDTAVASLPSHPAGLTGFLSGVHAVICGGNADSPPTAGEGVRSIELITAVYAAAENRVEVKLPLDPSHHCWDGWLA